jgi:hypothetical protein
MLISHDLAVFDKLREIIINEDDDIKHCCLISDLYANGFKDGLDFHYSSQAWDDIISSDPVVVSILKKWRKLEEYSNI